MLWYTTGKRYKKSHKNGNALGKMLLPSVDPPTNERILKPFSNQVIEENCLQGSYAADFL